LTQQLPLGEPRELSTAYKDPRSVFRGDAEEFSHLLGRFALSIQSGYSSGCNHKKAEQHKLALLTRK